MTQIKSQIQKEIIVHSRSRNQDPAIEDFTGKLTGDAVQK